MCYRECAKKNDYISFGKINCAISFIMKTGLINLGNSCFFNASVQCLMHVPELQRYFMGSSPSEYEQQHKYFPQRSNVLKEFSNQFEKLMKVLSDLDTRPVRPMSFHKILCVFKPVFRGSQQQDAHECLILILDKLHESLKMQVAINISGSTRSSIEERKRFAFDQYKKYIVNNGYSEINKIFYGQFESTVTCKRCKNVSFKYDPYCSLEVEIPKDSNTLYDCLDNYCFKELLNGEDMYNCEKCKSKVEATKMLKIWTIPKVMIIQLKRFDLRLKKNNRHIQFPEVLNMTKYITHPVAHDSDGNIGLQMYDLIGVIEHSGTLTGGHYISKCKTGNQWKSFNDTSVLNISKADICTTNGYVLMYRMNEHTQKLWN